MRFTRKVTRLGAASIIGIAVMAPAQAAVGDRALAFERPTISGVPVVGQTLTASVPTGDPTETLAFQWLRCDAERNSCDPILGATAPTYLVSAGDVDRYLAVRVVGTTFDERSELTAVVIAPPQPTPEPTPIPTATPAPTPAASRGDDPPLQFDRTSASPVAPWGDALGGPATSLEREERPARFMRPFPVVRITGTLVAGGARVSRLGIRAPAAARVAVRCTRSGCRYSSRTTGSGRVRALERFLAAGTRITIRISRPRVIGKYATIVIRDGRPPRRRDACLMPGSTQPVPCPAA
jgi:hypothetical protein